MVSGCPLRDDWPTQRAPTRDHICFTQFGVLVAIRELGEPRIFALSDATRIDRTTLTRTLARLQEQGLIALLPGADRRERRACLTDTGARRLEDAETRWAEAQSRLHDAIGDEDLAALERISNEIEGLAESSGR